MIQKKHLPVERVTQGPKHHFFGYFDKFPWDQSGRYLLANEINFTGRQPKVGESARLGMIDTHRQNRFIELAETKAWCWQQGCMLQWLNDCADTVIYNDREEEHFVARTLNVFSGETRTLSRPVYCLSPDGRYALSINFSRLDRERPGYGYNGAIDFTQGVDAPDNDGIFLVDLKNDASKLIISLKEINERFHRSDMENTPCWFNHLLFSPDSKRLAFFHRWRLWTPDRRPTHLTHMFTADIDGSHIFPLNLEDMSSHYTWTGPDKIINFSNRFATGWQYHHFTDRTHRVEIVAKDVFPGDGHCSLSPDGRWMLTDSYPLDDHCRKLFLYHLDTGDAFEIGSFYSDPGYSEPTRCDLHPNWSRDGRKVCIDSIHEDSRQMYVIDVTPIVG